MFARDVIPESFMQQHRQCCHLFVEHQTDTITQNLAWFKNMSVDERARMERVKQCCAWTYLEKCHLRPIDTNQKIVPDFQMVRVVAACF